MVTRDAMAHPLEERRLLDVQVDFVATMLTLIAGVAPRA